MPALRELDAIEKWFQSFIVDPAHDHDVSEREASQARKWIRPSATLDAVERVDVYRGQYLLRMEEALEADYPGLKHFLGEEGFFDFVARYVQQHPSRSYNLSRLSDDVPAFVAGDAHIRRRAFAAELARLELCICEVFASAPSPLLTQDAVAAVPETAWASMRVQPVEAFRLLELRYRVNEYLGSALQEERPGSTTRRHNYLVVWRHYYAMSRMALAPAEYRLLSTLLASGNLGDALRAATGGRQRMDPQEIFQSFARWVSEGFFSAIQR